MAYVPLCTWCQSPLVSNRRPGETTSGYAHGWCTLLHTVGHDVGLCGCTSPPYEGLTERQAAIECARRWRDRERER